MPVRSNYSRRYRALGSNEAVKAFEEMNAQRDAAFMRYYGGLRKVRLSVTDTYTAEGAWAHTDCCNIINARPFRPDHTLDHEAEHVFSDITGDSQSEYWIDFRARDPSRREIRSRYLVVVGDIY